MATSGSKSVAVTSWDTLKFSWEIASQSTANNTSTVSWTLQLIAGSSGRISSSAPKDWAVTVNGTKYSGTNYIGISNNQTKTLASGSTVIKHNSDGKKTFSYSFTQQIAVTFSGTYISEKSGSGSGELKTIPRASSLTASDGTLGTAQTLTISRADSSFTHTIQYKCGTASGTVCTKSSSTSIKWNTSNGNTLELAKQNASGTTVSVTFTLTTYSGSTQIGSAVTKKVTMSVPADVKPSCSVKIEDVSDPNATALYGNPVKGLSKFKVTITPTTSYGSAIESYKTVIGGVTYTAAVFTTDALDISGAVKITATVTDKRRRTGSSDPVNQTILDYNPPVISKLSVGRCNEDGSNNETGEWAKVSFSTSITDLGGKNSATHLLRYKKSSDGDSRYTDVTLAATDLNAGFYIFEADSGSSYDIEFSVKDNHKTTSRTTSVSTGFVLMHWNTAGDAMGIGKVAEEPDVLDIGMKTRHYGGLLPVLLRAETDLNDVRTPNTYIGDNIATNNYTNCPVSSGTFTLIVEGAGKDGQVRQTYIKCNMYEPQQFIRFYHKSPQGDFIWGDWMIATVGEVVLYENESGMDGTVTLSRSADRFAYLEIYYQDNNGRGCGYTKIWKPNGKTAHLQLQEAGTSVWYRQTTYTISGTTITPDLDTASYVKVTTTGAVSTVIGTNHIKIVKVVGLA